MNFTLFSNTYLTSFTINDLDTLLCSSVFVGMIYSLEGVALIYFADGASGPSLGKLKGGPLLCWLHKGLNYKVAILDQIFGYQCLLTDLKTGTQVALEY